MKEFRWAWTCGYSVALSNWFWHQHGPTFIFTPSVQQVHGAVRWLQCSKPCCPDVWKARRVYINVVTATGEDVTGTLLNLYWYDNEKNKKAKDIRITQRTNLVRKDMEPWISLDLPFLEMIIYTGVPAGIAWVRSDWNSSLLECKILEATLHHVNSQWCLYLLLHTKTWPQHLTCQSDIHLCWAIDVPNTCTARIVTWDFMKSMWRFGAQRPQLPSCARHQMIWRWPRIRPRIECRVWLAWIWWISMIWNDTKRSDSMKSYCKNHDNMAYEVTVLNL